MLVKGGGVSGYAPVQTDWFEVFKNNSNIVLAFNNCLDLLFINQTAKNFFSQVDFSRDSSDYFVTYEILAKAKNHIQNNPNSFSFMIELGELDKVNWKVFRLGKSNTYIVWGEHTTNPSDSNQWVTKVIEIFPGNCWWKDVNGVYKGCNQYLSENLGMQPEALLGKTDYQLPWKEQAKMLQSHDDKVMATGKKASHIESVEGKDNQNFHFYVVKSPLFDSEDKVVGTIGVSIDITELKQTQAQLEDALDKAKLAVKTHRTIFDNVKHNWITAISDFVAPLDVLEMMIEDPEQLEFLAGAKKGVEQLHRHVKAILDLVESGEGIPGVTCKPFNLREIATNVKEMYMASIIKRKVNFTFEVDEAPEYVRGDEFRLERIMIYMLSNAIKFEEGENNVLFAVRVLDETYEDYTVNIILQDTGMGMSADEVTQIYEPFYRGTPAYQTKIKNDGNGVGLTITKQYIEDLGGQIDCVSEKGVGTTFVVALKLKKSITPKAVLDALKP